MATASTGNQDLELESPGLRPTLKAKQNSIIPEPAQDISDRLKLQELLDFKLSTMEQQLEDPSLKDELMYVKIKKRIVEFFTSLEKNKGKIPNNSDVNMKFQIQLYKSLRQQLLHIVHIPDMQVKMTQLRQLYEWFFQRLVSIGALNRAEILEETKFLNPMLD